MPKVIGFDKSLKLEVTCHDCTAIIEYTPSEVKSEVQTDYTGGRDTVYYISCPNCSKTIYGVKRYR